MLVLFEMGSTFASDIEVEVMVAVMIRSIGSGGSSEYMADQGQVVSSTKNVISSPCESFFGKQRV